MFDLPLGLVLVFLFLLGTIIGSFLDVFVSRFHTGRSINGRSHCASCGHTLTWFELFPLFSYVALRGRCRVCGARIPARLFWMEVVTGLLFVLVGSAVSTPAELLIGCVFVALAVVITMYDVRHMIIPDVFVGAMMLLAVLALVTSGELTTISSVWSHALAAGGAASFYFSLWFFSGGKWIGLGDAKLAFPLGLILTPYEAFSFVVLSFWVGAVISVSLLLLQWLYNRGQRYLRFFDLALTIKSEVPFAPFLLVAFALVYFYGVDVLQLFLVSL